MSTDTMVMVMIVLIIILAFGSMIHILNILKKNQKGVSLSLKMAIKPILIWSITINLF